LGLTVGRLPNASRHSSATTGARRVGRGVAAVNNTTLTSGGKPLSETAVRGARLVHGDRGPRLEHRVSQSATDQCAAGFDARRLMATLGLSRRRTPARVVAAARENEQRLWLIGQVGQVDADLFG
jgi:hypothetical protein